MTNETLARQFLTNVADSLAGAVSVNSIVNEKNLAVLKRMLENVGNRRYDEGYLKGQMAGYMDGYDIGYEDRSFGL